MHTVKVSSRLFIYLEETKKGIILEAPTDVYLTELQSVVQPDIMVIMEKNRSLIYEDGVHGAPDIIFEILLGNHIHDTVKKEIAL